PERLQSILAIQRRAAFRARLRPQMNEHAVEYAFTHGMTPLVRHWPAHAILNVPADLVGCRPRVGSAESRCHFRNLREFHLHKRRHGSMPRPRSRLHLYGRKVDDYRNPQVMNFQVLESEGNSRAATISNR